MCRRRSVGGLLSAISKKLRSRDEDINLRSNLVRFFPARNPNALFTRGSDFARSFLVGVGTSRREDGTATTLSHQNVSCCCFTTATTNDADRDVRARDADSLRPRRTRTPFAPNKLLRSIVASSLVRIASNRIESQCSALNLQPSAYVLCGVASGDVSVPLCPSVLHRSRLCAMHRDCISHGRAHIRACCVDSATAYLFEHYPRSLLETLRLLSLKTVVNATPVQRIEFVVRTGTLTPFAPPVCVAIVACPSTTTTRIRRMRRRAR